jgi:hypothetical protein
MIARPSQLTGLWALLVLSAVGCPSTDREPAPATSPRADASGSAQADVSSVPTDDAADGSAKSSPAQPSAQSWAAQPTPAPSEPSAPASDPDRAVPGRDGIAPTDSDPGKQRRTDNKPADGNAVGTSPSADQGKTPDFGSAAPPPSAPAPAGAASLKPGASPPSQESSDEKSEKSAQLAAGLDRLAKLQEELRRAMPGTRVAANGSDTGQGDKAKDIQSGGGGSVTSGAAHPPAAKFPTGPQRPGSGPGRGQSAGKAGPGAAQAETGAVKAETGALGESRKEGNSGNGRPQPDPNGPVGEHAKQDARRKTETLQNRALIERQSGRERKNHAQDAWKKDVDVRPRVARVLCSDLSRLELVALHVSVIVEGPRARTVVDHVFRNPHDQALEGTFEYPLPTGASPSYYAMFVGRDAGPKAPRRLAPKGDQPLPAADVAALAPAALTAAAPREDWGSVREGRIVPRQQALEVYEEIVRSEADPALLEYAFGNTFRGRVFPIPARGYNRVILAYEETVPATAAGAEYRFPLPAAAIGECSFTLRAADADDCRDARLLPAGADPVRVGGGLVYQRLWAGQAPGGDAVFAFRPARAGIQAVSGAEAPGGRPFVFARVRPDLPRVAAAPFSDKAVFLLDTSASENAGRFDLGMKLMRRILESDPAVKQFNVLCFDVSARWVRPGRWLPNTPAGRAEAFGALDGVLLEGATDVSAALDALAAARFAKPGEPVNAFLLSDGQTTWGETNAAAVSARFEGACRFPARFHCYDLGDGAYNDALFGMLTRRGGGVFACRGEADLAAAASAHRRECLTITKIGLAGGPAFSDVLVAGRRSAVYPGGELLLAARASEAGAAEVVLEGTFAGKPFSQRFPLSVTGDGELAPRAWGELAVAGLLASGEPRLEPTAVDLCRRFGIVSRVASFLVLENDADFAKHGIADAPPAMPEADIGELLEMVWTAEAQPVGPREAFERCLRRADDRLRLLAGPEGPAIRSLLHLLGDVDLTLPPAPVAGRLMTAADAGDAYRNARTTDSMLAEAKRRAEAGRPGEAVRALSGIVEARPGRSDVLRTAGYRLLEFGLPSSAAALFAAVQRDRPFEPHSYRDLARSLQDAGKWGWAAVNYEIALAGQWHSRFRDGLPTVVREEYLGLMRQALRRPDLPAGLRARFAERSAQLSAAASEDDLRVTITWNTDSTDVDLHVIEPDGTVCKFDRERTPNGGELSGDMTKGYGPERYRIRRAKPGPYRIVLHYFRANPALVEQETHVDVVVVRRADSPAETVERHSVVLRRADERREVATVRF